MPGKTKEIIPSKSSLVPSKFIEVKRGCRCGFLTGAWVIQSLLYHRKAHPSMSEDSCIPRPSCPICMYVGQGASLSPSVLTAFITLGRGLVNLITDEFTEPCISLASSVKSLPFETNDGSSILEED